MRIDIGQLVEHLVDIGDLVHYIRVHPIAGIAQLVVILVQRGHHEIGLLPHYRAGRTAFRHIRQILPGVPKAAERTRKPQTRRLVEHRSRLARPRTSRLIEHRLDSADRAL